MKKKLLLVSCFVALSGSIDARYDGGYHGGYGRGYGGAVAAGALTSAALIGTTAAISSSNNANQDPYAKVDRYQADQELAELKAESRQKELDRKEEERDRRADEKRQRDDQRQSKKRKKSNSNEEDRPAKKVKISSDENQEKVSNKKKAPKKLSAKQQKIQDLENQLAELKSSDDNMDITA